jgi:hypothetical protein
VTQYLQIVGTIHCQVDGHAFTFCHRPAWRRTAGDRQKRHLAYVSFQAQITLKVPAHLLELCPGHKGRKIKVATDLFDDRFFR